MYSEEFISGAIVPKSNASLTAYSASAAAADYASWAVMEQVQLTRIMLFVTTAIVGTTTAPVVAFYARPTPGSSSGQILLGKLTLPSGTAAGVVVYKEIESVKIPPGYDLAVVGDTQAVGSAAGAGFAGFKGFVNAEDPRNVSVMLKSV